LQVEVPTSLRVSDGGDLLLMEMREQVGAGRGPSPDVNGAITLEDCVIGKEVG
jgi:hypothetical protein